MRKIHVLKFHEEYFKEVIAERKTFEIRLNDRNYQVGDLIHFVRVDKKEFKNQKDNLFEIIYVLNLHDNFGLIDNYCIFSIKRVSKDLIKEDKINYGLY